MIRAGFDSGPILEAFRAQYRAARPSYVVVPMALDPLVAGELRARVEAAGLHPFEVADRGRYRVQREHLEPALFESVRAFAAAIVDGPLELDALRWLGLAHGDYELMRGDAVDRSWVGRCIEVTVDFSEKETGQGEICYTDGTNGFGVPQWPGSIALVERPEGNRWYRYQRYLDHRVGAARVFRLQLWFRISDTQLMDCRGALNHG